jgi:hypothetical protein
VDGTHATANLVAVAVAARGTDLVVAGTGSGNFGCVDGDTGEASFAAAIRADGSCRWSRGLRTRTISDVEVRDDGNVAVAGVCTPSGPFFDPAPATTCTKGSSSRCSRNGRHAAVGARRHGHGDGRKCAISRSPPTAAPRWSATRPGSSTSARARWPSARRRPRSPRPTGRRRDELFRPIEAPYAEDPDALALALRYDRSGRLWLAGRYAGQPTLGGVRLSACRAPAARLRRSSRGSRRTAR